MLKEREWQQQSLFPSQVQGFGFEEDTNGKPVDDDHPICKKCSRMVATKDGNTSNLLLHLCNVHPDAYQRTKGVDGSLKWNEKTTAAAGQQQMLEEVVARGTPYAQNSKRWERLTNVVTHCVAKCYIYYVFTESTLIFLILVVL